MPTTGMMLRKLTSSDHMPWVEGRSGYLFQSTPLEINADPETTWSLVRNPNQYDTLSHGAVWAHVNGPVAVNSHISFKLFRHKLLGKLIPKSYEVISKVEDEGKTIGWERKIPFIGTTERYQVLETNDQGKTMSYIALRVPGIVGFFSKCFLKSTIEDSFNQLNAGIKDQAEQSIHNVETCRV